MPRALVLLLLVLGQLGAPPRDVARQTSSAAISGRVTERGSGRPLPRIVVTLGKANSSAPVETLTDQDGRYQFTEIEPGAYALIAGRDRHHSTYLPQRYGADEPGNIFSLDPPQPNLQLKAGETRVGLDFALWRALGIEGRILDPSETGMANVSVIVKRVTDRVWPSAHAYSDDRGMFRAYGLAPGRYHVCANIEQRSDSAAEIKLGPSCYPAGVDETQAGEVVLTSEDATGIDVRAQQTRSYSFSLSGSVVDSSGSPVAGAFVGAYPVDGEGPSASGSVRQGDFALTGLAPRRYVIRASIDERPPDDPDGNRSARVGYAFADLSAGDTAGLLVPLSKAVEVRGKITFEGMRGGIRGPGMVVQTSPVPTRLTYFGMRPPFSPVGDDLSFNLVRVYRLPLIVGMTGIPEGWTLKSVRYDGRDITYVPTDFGARTEAARVEIILTNRISQPLVRVLDEQGKPIVASHVVAVPADPSRWMLPFAIVAATRAEGDLMKLGPMLPGEYFVAALSRDDGLLLFSDRPRVDALATVGTRVRLAEGDRPTLDLRIVSLPPR